MANQLDASPIRALDANGNPVSGARLRFYLTGTSTPVTVYTDATLTTPHDSDGILSNSSGVFALAFYDGSNQLKADATIDGVSLPGYPLDPIRQTADTSSGAAELTFSPITGNNATNVQGAIANVTNLWNAVTAYGKSLIAAADAGAARTALGLGGLATLDVLDEDDMATDSATRPPSQQSTKAYVDGLQPVAQVIATGSLNGTGTPAWNWRAGFSATVTDNGAGNYTVAFDAAEANTNYAVALNADAGGTRYFINYDAKTTSGFIITVADVTGAAVDALADISITVTRAV